MRTIEDWKLLFNTINKDSFLFSLSPIPLTETEYYAEQISNLLENEGTELPFTECLKIASQLS